MNEYLLKYSINFGESGNLDMTNKEKETDTCVCVVVAV